MKKYPFFVGTNEEAAELIIAFYMTSGEETWFIKTIPQNKHKTISEILKAKSEYVYRNVISDFNFKK